MPSIHRHPYARLAPSRGRRRVALLACLVFAACEPGGPANGPGASGGASPLPSFQPSAGGTETTTPANTPTPQVDATRTPDVAEPTPESDTGPIDAPPDSPPTGCGELTAEIDTDVSEGRVPLTVTLDWTSSCTPHEIAEASWSIGDIALSGHSVSHTFLGTGTHTVTLTLTDVEDQTYATTTEITVTPGLCPFSGQPVTQGLLASNELNEPSGLAASPTLDGVLWTHNDSDGLPRLYAVGVHGESIAAFDVAGATNVDWEDIAVGRDPVTGQVIVFVWDGGDNNGARESVQVFMVAEPTEELLEVDPSPVLASTHLELTYPDGDAHNSDTLLFDPQTGDLYVVAMDSNDESHLFHKPAPHVPESQTELVWVRTLPFGEPPLAGSIHPKGGSLSPLGDQILLRTLDSAYLWLRDGSQPLATAFDTAPCPGPFLVEDGGESIEFSADGQGYFSMAEKAHAALLFSTFGPPNPCGGLEARFDISPVGALHVPVEVTFTVDETCIPTGVDWVSWTIDGVATDEAQPTVTFLHAGPVEVSLTVMDNDGASASTDSTLELLPPTCPYSEEAETWGTLALEDINETSGVVVSTQNPGVLWLHNDSGDSARFFAIGPDGSDLGTWSIDTQSRDWEDLAYGYDETLDTEALYIGDVGDNGKTRTDIVIYIVPEPTVEAAESPTTQELDTWNTMTLTYPDGEAHNCETLMRDPQTGDLYLVTKSGDGISPVFRKPAPHEDGSETELEWVTELVFGEGALEGSKSTTAGGFAPTGDRLLIRTYTHAWLWHREPGQSIADALATEVCDAQAPDEPQGEAICFTQNGEGYITISEGVGSTVFYTPLQ